MDVIKDLNLFILFSIFVQGVISYNKFCSVACGNQSCSTNQTGTCNGICSAPWTWNGNSCELSTSSGYSLVDKSIEIGGTITPNNTG